MANCRPQLTLSDRGLITHVSRARTHMGVVAVLHGNHNEDVYSQVTGMEESE
jgi:hypothetical protein